MKNIAMNPIIIKRILRFLITGWFCSSILYGQAKFNLVGGIKFDFGEVNLGTTVQRILTIKNDGTDTLIITNVSASCGCTGTLLSNDHITPGDSGALSISFNSKKFSGKVEKAVTMNTNDPQNKKVRIIFVANIVTILEFEPEYLFFRSKPDSETTQMLTLKNSSPEPLRILSVKSDLESVSLSVSENEIEPGKIAKLTASLHPRAPGTIKGNIEIKTDNPKVSRFNVRVVALITGKTSP
jgi:hypothetical protein